MQALVTTPGVHGTTRVETVPEPVAGPGQVLVRTLEVGVCGTDREISEGLFGVAPVGERDLVLGHELLGVVVVGGGGFAEGDLVSATVRRSCGHCAACEAGSPDGCLTGDYVERGITRLDGFARERFAEDPAQLVAVPRSLERYGVLAEPGAVCARAIRHAGDIGGRQVWPGRRALVIGTGAIGVLTACFLRLLDWQTWVAGLAPDGSPEAGIVTGLGARYFAVGDTPLADLADEAAGFDLVIEAAGDADVMLQAPSLLARSGVACLLGLDGRPRELRVDGQRIGVDLVLRNLALFGSVNAHPDDWPQAVAWLDEARGRWPDVLDTVVSLRAAPDDFAQAFEHRGVKATLRFGT